MSVSLFAPPALVETEVYASLPDELRVPSRIASGFADAASVFITGTDAIMITAARSTAINLFNPDLCMPFIISSFPNILTALYCSFLLSVRIYIRPHTNHRRQGASERHDLLRQGDRKSQGGQHNGQGQGRRR